jgi:hypothetical protein
MADSRAKRVWMALALAVAVGACGGSDFGSGASPSRPPTRPAPPISRPAIVHRPALRAALVRSASTTRSARTARTSISVTVTGLGEDTFANGAFDVAGTGVVDLASGNADLLLSIPLFDHLGGGGAIEERITGGIAYARLPAAVMRVGGLPPAVRWLRIDAAPVRKPPSTLSQSQVDPAGELAFLDSVSDDVQRLGVEAVRGTNTTHYTATIPAAPGTGAVTGAGKGTALGERLGALGTRFGTGTLVVDVWIDAAGRVRRIVVSVPLAGIGAAKAGPATAALRMQADFFAFGVPVAVTAPPAAQVRPYAALRLPAASAG